MTTTELAAAREGMRGLKGKNVIGADIVCIIPTKDSPNNITTLTAMVIMFEQLCLIAEYLRGKKK